MLPAISVSLDMEEYIQNKYKYPQRAFYELILSYKNPHFRIQLGYSHSVANLLLIPAVL